jgi:hypothetical protein
MKEAKEHIQAAHNIANSLQKKWNIEDHRVLFTAFTTSITALFLYEVYSQFKEPIDNYVANYVNPGGLGVTSAVLGAVYGFVAGVVISKSRSKDIEEKLLEEIGDRITSVMYKDKSRENLALLLQKRKVKDENCAWIEKRQLKTPTGELHFKYVGTALAVHSSVSFGEVDIYDDEVSLLGNYSKELARSFGIQFGNPNKEEDLVFYGYINSDKNTWNDKNIELSTETLQNLAYRINIATQHFQRAIEDGIPKDEEYNQKDLASILRDGIRDGKVVDQKNEGEDVQISNLYVH